MSPSEKLEFLMKQMFCLVLQRTGANPSMLKWMKKKKSVLLHWVLNWIHGVLINWKCFLKLLVFSAALWQWDQARVFHRKGICYTSKEQKAASFSLCCIIIHLIWVWETFFASSHCFSIVYFLVRFKWWWSFFVAYKKQSLLLEKCLGVGVMHEILGSAETHLGLFSLQAVILLGHRVAVTWKQSLYEIVQKAFWSVFCFRSVFDISSLALEYTDSYTYESTWHVLWIVLGNNSLKQCIGAQPGVL